MQPSIGHFDCPLSTELDELSVCTQLLDLGEYRIFEVAYRAWYGREPSEADLKPGFGAYLRGLRLPPFVRHYCRRTIAEAETDGRLRRPAEPRPDRPDLDAAFAAALSALLLTILTLA